MQPVRRAAAVADEVKTQLAVAAFHRVIDLADRDWCFAHHHFEVVDQRLHFGVNILFLRQIPEAGEKDGVCRGNSG